MQGWDRTSLSSLGAYWVELQENNQGVEVGQVRVRGSFTVTFPDSML